MYARFECDGYLIACTLFLIIIIILICREFRGGGHGYPQGGRRDFHPSAPPYVRPPYDSRHHPFGEHTVPEGEAHWNSLGYQPERDELRRSVDPRPQDLRPQDPRRHHVRYQISPDRMSPRPHPPIDQPPLAYNLNSPVSSDCNYQSSPLHEKHHPIDSHAHNSSR